MCMCVKDMVGEGKRGKREKEREREREFNLGRMQAIETRPTKEFPVVQYAMNRILVCCSRSS